MKYLNCAGCGARCCRYVSVEIDKPKTKQDLEIILWYLYHEDVYVFIESGVWHVQFNSRCKNLDGRSNCKIYEERPSICKKLKVHECERHGSVGEKDITFKNAKQFLAYVKKNKLIRKK